MSTALLPDSAAESAHGSALSTGTGQPEGVSAALAGDTETVARWPHVVAVLLGALILLGVGFGPGFAHNAAHDTRHSLGFVCH